MVGAENEPAPVGSGYGPGTPRTGQPADSEWPVQTGGECYQCALQIQQQIGGQLETLDPPAGARYLGPSTNNPNGLWQYHTFVLKDGLAYDSFTGPQGVPLNEYLQRWEFGSELTLRTGGPK